MADFRNTTNEFKATWEREVNFEEEVKALTDIEADEPGQTTVARASAGENTIAPPEIKPAQPDMFADLPNQPQPQTISSADAGDLPTQPQPQTTATDSSADDDLSDKRSWL